jgi:tagatose 1,6-diphosphate aldolase
LKSQNVSWLRPALPEGFAIHEFRGYDQGEEMVLSKGKLKHMQALANNRGVIAAAAMDQRGSLQKALAQAKGVDKKEITPEIIGEFKTIVAKVLTPHASAILLDPEYGLEAKDARSANCGVLLAYELSGYDNTQPGRLPDLLPHVSARRIVQWGADAVKVLIYYTPDEDAAINDVKHALVERVGDECASCQIPFFLEIVTYDAKGRDEKGLDYAQAKPGIVIGGMEEFSKPQYQVDVLKVEVPINTDYMEGSSVYRGQKAYSEKEAGQHFHAAGAASTTTVHFLERWRQQRTVRGIAADGRRGGRQILGSPLRPSHLEGRNTGLRQERRRGARRMAVGRGCEEHPGGQRRHPVGDALVQKGRCRSRRVTAILGRRMVRRSSARRLWRGARRQLRDPPDRP